MLCQPTLACEGRRCVCCPTMNAAAIRAIGHLEAQRHALEISHDLVSFEAPKLASMSAEALEACRDVNGALELRAKWQERLSALKHGQVRAGDDARLLVRRPGWCLSV